MDMFAVDEDVVRWETALLSLRGVERLSLLCQLAWHMRQRDTERALRLADEADTLLPKAQFDAVRQQSDGARLALVRAEARWLSGQLDEAFLRTQAILQQARSIDDVTLAADAHWLLAWISIDQGEHARADTELAACGELARGCGDSIRVELSDACRARWAVLHDLNYALRTWGERFNERSDPTHLAIAVWVYDYLALAASQAADFGAAAGYYIRCYEAALETGQLRAAITAATNIAEDFTLLNDHHSALEWVQTALELARPTGWPRSVGACLMHSADTLRRLGQLDSASEMLEEALETLTPFANARSYGMALQFLGDLCLDRQDHAGALDAFLKLEARGEALDQADFRSAAGRGQAHAMSYLGRAEEALEVAANAVRIAAEQHNSYNQIAALRVIAMIHSHHDLPAPPGMTELNPALHYLHQALTVASTIDGYTVPGDLLDQIAREYANAGDFEHAYEIALSASVAREKTHSQEATNRAIAMQAHHQTEHARNEGYHHRELAESEARRAEVLQRTSATLERLSSIGQEITAHLDAEAVFETLNRHIHGLLTASTFAIYLTDPTGKQLERAFGIELGKPLPDNKISLTNQDAFSVRCLTERREIYVENWLEESRRSPVVPGTIQNLSALFSPLVAGDKTIGVMTVQAIESHAYGETERMVFRTLCAYGAIALDNADTYQRLQDAQTQLVSQEKLAALGSLMAGVAHELNTPIGNSLLIASTMHAKTVEIEQLMNGAGLKRSDLANFIADAQKASTLVMRGLTSAADLVSSFKQVAVDRTTEQRRNFNLHLVCHEIIATMMNRVRAASHEIDLEVPEVIGMDSYPGPFGQVITNFINNALLHAFDGQPGGRMHLSASLSGADRVIIRFKDNGAGISAEHLHRIFDPFFTTKLGQGGSGLGLSISYNIVTSLLGGQVTVNSSAEAGTTFTLDLPLTAPVHDQDIPSTIY